MLFPFLLSKSEGAHQKHFEIHNRLVLQPHHPLHFSAILKKHLLPDLNAVCTILFRPAAI